MRKAAKVYEAGESVEGNKPKVVYESHKKCTPGEFGARVKESTATIGGASVAGAGLGALLGALRAPKGKMLKYTLGGAGIGGLAGAGSAAGYNLIPNRDYGGPTSLAKLPLALGGGALAGHLGNKLYDEVEEYIPEKKDKKQEKKQEKEAAGSGGVLGRFLAAAATVGGAGAALNAAAKKRLPSTGNTPPINTPTIAENAAARRREIDGLIKANSAREFGQKVAFNIDLSMLKNPAIGGAVLGAGLGGLTGLIAPGEDENGKTRSRFGAMLRGALGGGALGTAGGAAIGHFAPNLPRDIYNFGRRTLTGKNQAQLNMADNVSVMSPQQQALHARAMRPFRKPKSITEQFPEEISFPQQQ